MEMLDPNNIHDVRRAMDIVAQLAAENPTYLPIFESFEKDYSLMKIGETSHARAVRIARRRRDMATLI
jgi:hypothetical protein